MKKKALVIETKGTSRDIDWPLDLDAMQKCVGGLIEYVRDAKGKEIVLPNGSLGVMRECIVNEEGLMLGLDPNVLASLFVNGGDINGIYNLVGPAIVVYEERDGSGAGYINKSIMDALSSILNEERVVISLGDFEEE